MLLERVLTLKRVVPDGELLTLSEAADMLGIGVQAFVDLLDRVSYSVDEDGKAVLTPAFRVLYDTSEPNTQRARRVYRADVEAERARRARNRRKK